MGTLDVALPVGFGVVGGLNVALGVAVLARSRRQRGVTIWRGQRLVAPRLYACVHLFLGLLFTVMALSGVVKPRSNGDDLLFLAGTMFGAAVIVTAVMWFLRWVRTARHPTSS
ncbi:MAG TPA: hypothetical protein VFM55_23840 [Micromonosporaceae bacterium]|nr:hypothetical protein [Micromonosporaceae bacterium]